MEKKFRIISIVFIIGCIITYSIRFGYFYFKYNKSSSNNKKAETLSITIQKDNGVVSKGDGLYNNSGELVFKGKKVNNYLIYSNILWRIIRVNNDNSVVLVTDSKLTDLTLEDSLNWLNKTTDNTGIFESKLEDKEKYLVPNTICLDKVTNLNNITCHKKDTKKYVGLLSIGDYLNSKNTDSYINNTDSIWLNNYKDDKNAWVITKGNLASDLITKDHGIKAVITIKNTIGKISGKGTKEDPYVILKSKTKFNSYVKLDNDLYTIYDIDSKNYKLVNTKLINDINSRYFDRYKDDYDLNIKTSIAFYLNNTYFNSLKYKDKLVDCDFYVADYNTSYKDIYNKKVSAKVGLLSIADINLDNSLNNYFLLNKNHKVASYLSDGSALYSNKIRNTVCISKSNKLIGNGTLNNPFTLEG